MNCYKLLADLWMNCNVQIIKIVWPDISSWGPWLFQRLMTTTMFKYQETDEEGRRWHRELREWDQGEQRCCCPWSLAFKKSWPQDEIILSVFWNLASNFLTITILGHFSPTLHSGLTTCGHPAASRHRVFSEWRGTSTGPQSWASRTTSWKINCLFDIILDKYFRIVFTVDSRYNAPGYNAVPDITLIISGPRSNKKHVKWVPL